MASIKRFAPICPIPGQSVRVGTIDTDGFQPIIRADGFTFTIDPSAARPPSLPSAAGMMSRLPKTVMM